MKNVIYSRKHALSKGFTQVELLVIVGVVGVLAMMGLAASTKLSNQTKIARCANNLRQLNMAQLVYATDNLDNLPAVSAAGGTWLWDTPVSLTTTLLQYGAATNTMYCPGTSPRFTDEQNFVSPGSLWNFGASGGLRIIGYALTLGTSSLAAANRNVTTVPQPITTGPGVLPPPIPSQRVLTADANLTMGGGNFTAINGGFVYNGVLYPHICPHLEGNYPAGGNVAMLDGHVQWRPFQQMIVRTTGFGGGLPTPNFYW